MLKASVIHADETGDASNAIFHGAAKKVNADAWLVGAGMVPSGYVNIAIENDNENSGFSHEKW